jgi:nicotinate-nucleotide pyrophosphorylase (carboxylating)
MLDNFTPEEMKVAARNLKRKWNAEENGNGGSFDRSFGRVDGGECGGFVCGDVDVISTSSIHQGVKHVDFFVEDCSLSS